MGCLSEFNEVCGLFVVPGPSCGCRTPHEFYRCGLAVAFNPMSYDPSREQFIGQFRKFLGIVHHFAPMKSEL